MNLFTQTRRPLFILSFIFLQNLSAVVSLAQTIPTKQWDANFGGSSTDQMNNVVRATDGGYVMGGWSLSGLTGDKTQDTRGGYDYWVVKTDANGVKLWDRRF